MSLMPINVVGGATFGRYGKISNENTYNMFVSDSALVSSLGYKSVKSIPGHESRGLFYSPTFNIMIHVIDNSVYSVDSRLNYQKVGTLETFTGLVYIAENNAEQFAISDLSNIYIYVHSGSVSKVTTLPTGFLPGYIDFQDGYFICGDRNSSAWNLSHLNDGLIWTPLDPGTGLSYSANFETKPDTVQATIAFNRMLFVMGNNGTELWRDVGNELFPYQRDNYVSIDYGCLSIGSIAEGFGYVVWLAKNEYASASLMYSNGGTPVEMATDGINFLIDKLEHPERSIGFIYQSATHIFYQITFYSDDLTLIYDFNTQMFFTATDEKLNHHIAKRLCHFNNTDYFISYGSAEDTEVQLYELSADYTTYDGKTIPRYRICAPVRQPTAQQFKIKNVSLTMEQGATAELEKVALCMSKNGGLSYGTWVTNNCNPLAYGPNKMRWWQLGSANDVIFKFAFWSGDTNVHRREEHGKLDERFVIIDAQVEVE